MDWFHTSFFHRGSAANILSVIDLIHVERQQLLFLGGWFYYWHSCLAQYTGWSWKSCQGFRIADYITVAQWKFLLCAVHFMTTICGFKYSEEEEDEEDGAQRRCYLHTMISAYEKWRKIFHWPELALFWSSACFSVTKLHYVSCKRLLLDLSL